MGSHRRNPVSRFSGETEPDSVCDAVLAGIDPELEALQPMAFAAPVRPDAVAHEMGGGCARGNRDAFAHKCGGFALGGIGRKETR